MHCLSMDGFVPWFNMDGCIYPPRQGEWMQSGCPAVTCHLELEIEMKGGLKSIVGVETYQRLESTA